jgi:hypothetical protein
MKHLKSFATQSEFEEYMSGNKGETIFPTIALVDSQIKYYSLLPNIDTTGYATTFVNGETYEKEAQLFRLIVNDFLEGYDIENEDPAIWMDLSEGIVDISLFTNRQTFSIVDEPLYVNYLSKITNFCDDEGVPTSTLNIFPAEVTRDEYYISGGESTSVSSRLDLNTGVFEEVTE